MTKESKEKIKIGAPYSKEYLKKIFLGASLVAGVGLLGSANTVQAVNIAEPTAIVESTERESISIFQTPSDQTEEAEKTSEKEISIFNREAEAAQAKKTYESQPSIINNQEAIIKEAKEVEETKNSTMGSKEINRTQASARRRAMASRSRINRPTSTPSPRLNTSSFNLQKANILANVLEMSGERDFGIQRAPQKATDPNYAEDEKNVGTYKETQLERGNGPYTSYDNLDEENRFIDGYRYNTLEPGATSPDKTLWGFEIEFDRDQGQRTYTDFTFTNSGLLAAFLPGGTNEDPEKVHSVQPGIKIGNDFKEASYKANTSIDLVASRQQRNLNLYASEEDLKHINSIDTNNTTMAWEGHYLKDHSGTLYATQGPNSTFTFTVNPWPNENDQLSLITLSGSHDKKEFVQGQTINTEVKINNLDDNARERLVGQVYHPTTGEVVPGAEAYINDQDKVVIKMPDGVIDENGNLKEDSIFYSDPNYKGLQNLEVKFFARPRTAEEFKTVSDEANFGGGFYTPTGAGEETINHKGESVTIDKQGIPRYDHYNEVGRFKINLDDTRYYNQTFDKKIVGEDEKATRITPGETLVMEIDPSKNENPDKYEKSPEDMRQAYKNGEAVYKLDPEFVKMAEDKGWTINMDGKDISKFEVSAPIGAKAGDFIAVPLTYTYTNGSTDVHWFHFVVQESTYIKPEYETQVNFPSRQQTSPATVTEDGKRIPPDHYTLPDTLETDGAGNKLIKDDLGNEWAVSIDGTTGQVTAQPVKPEDFVGGEKLTVPVIAHYVDKQKPGEDITENVDAYFVIKEKANMTARYNAKAGKSGDVLSSDIILNEEDTYNRRPTKFTLDSDTFVDDKGNTWNVTINENTGTVTATVPEGDGDKIDGALLNVPVTAHYFEMEDGKEVPMGTRQTEVQFVASGTDGTYVKTEEIPFETKVEKDPNLKDYEIRVITEGKTGSKKVTYVIKDSEVDETKTKEEILEKPQDRLIHVGNKVEDGSHDIVENIPVPFETRIEFSDDLKPGETKVIYEGELGEQTRTTTIKIQDGKVVDVKEGDLNQIKAPKERVIQVGRNTEGKVEHKEPIPFKYTVEFDPKFHENYPDATDNYKVVTEGVAGEKTTTWVIENSKIVKGPDQTVTKKPVDAVIKIGQKDYTGTFETKKTKAIEFETEYKVDNSLEPGQVVVEQEGSLGEEETTVTHTIVNGEVTKSEEGQPVQTKAPVKRIVKVGPGKTDGTHKIEEKEEVPFEVEIQFDDSLAPGEQKVTQEGVPGEKIRTTTLTIENSEVTKTEVGDFEVTKQPVKKIIKVGRNTEGEVKHVEEIPFKYTVNEVDTLKKGEYEIVKPGKVGSKTTTWKIENSEIVGEPKTEIIEAEDAIINVGKGTNEGTHEVTEKIPVPFETIIEFDDNLAPGEQKVTQEGELGEKTRTTTLTIEDGKVTNTEAGEFEQNKAPVNRIIKVGRNTDGEVVHKEEIPFKYTIEYDPELKAGEYRVETPGRNGERITTWTIKNSKVDGDPKVVETQPIDAVIKVGKKDYNGTFTTKETKAVEFDTEYRVNNELKPGEVKVVQKGELGEEQVTVTHTIENGKVINSEKGQPERTKEPVKRIVEVGPGTTDGTYERVEEIPFETKVEKDPTLKKGEIKVITEGEKGSKKVTYTIKDSKVDETKTKEEVIKEATDRVIHVGEGVNDGTHTITEEVDVPFETKIEFDDSLKPGEQKVTQEGEPGKKSRDITLTIQDGKVTNTEEGEFTQTKAPKDKIIKVGRNTEGKVEHKEEIPFDYKIEEVDDLKKGEYRIVKPGKVGTKTTTWTIENSKVVGKPTEEIVPAEDALIQVGKGTNDGTHDIVEKKEIPFETRYEYDDSLEPGEEKVVTPGSPGEQERTNTIKIQDGKVVEIKEGEFKTTKEPVDKIVKIGTKPVVNVVEKPFETEYIYDENLEMGKEEEVTPGKKGKTTITTYYDKDQKKFVTKEETEEPTNRVVKIGIKPTVNEEPIPHNTKYEYNPELKAGEIKKVKDGTPGKIIITTTFNKETGKIETKIERIEPTDAVYEYGSKTEGKVTVESDIPFEVEIIEDPEMEAGETKVVQEGKLGKKETTITIENSKEVSRDEDIIKEPVKKIIKVGTKNVCEIPPEKPDPDKPDPDKPGTEEPDPENPDDGDKPDPENPPTPGGEDPKDPGNPPRPGEDDPYHPPTPGDDRPIIPWNPNPIRPINPGNEEPGTPGTEEPGKPGEEKPFEPGTPEREEPTKDPVDEETNDQVSSPEETREESSYKDSDLIPKTGDETRQGLWLGLSGFSLAGLLVALKKYFEKE